MGRRNWGSCEVQGRNSRVAAFAANSPLAGDISDCAADVGLFRRNLVAEASD